MQDNQENQNNNQIQGTSSQTEPIKFSGMAIAGLVLGIVALIGSWVPILNNVSFFIGLVGLVLCIVAMVGTFRNRRRGKALSVISAIICVIAMIVVFATQSAYSTAINDAVDTLNSDENISATVEEDNGAVDPESVPETEAEIEAEPAPEPETEPEPAVEPEVTESADIPQEDAASTNDADVPSEYQSALKRAESYSNNMHMSKQGIYNQLTSDYGDKFSADAAQYAVDNVNADWNANALAKAESYQNSMNMSPSAIYDQLISEYGEKFTPEEAQYAIDHLS